MKTVFYISRSAAWFVVVIVIVVVIGFGQRQKPITITNSAETAIFGAV
jgi:hypothetical protein